MKNVTGPRHSVEEPDGGLLNERRRPGRIEDVSPELIPLMRGKTEVPDQPSPPLQRYGQRTDGDRVSRAETTLWIALAAWMVIWVWLAAGGWNWLFEDPRSIIEPPAVMQHSRIKGEVPDITR